MTTRLIFVALLLSLPISAKADGLIADSLKFAISPGAAKALDEANINLNRALKKATTESATGSTQPITQSKTCVTPRGLCEIQQNALSGTTCYCNISEDEVFGRIQ